MPGEGAGTALFGRISAIANGRLHDEEPEEEEAEADDEDPETVEVEVTADEVGGMLSDSFTLVP